MVLLNETAAARFNARPELRNQADANDRQASGMSVPLDVQIIRSFERSKYWIHFFDI